MEKLMTKQQLEFRSYQAGDETAILDLFRQSYGHDLGLKVWAWRFRDNPAGPGVIDLAWDDNNLAAHYAVTSVAMRIAGQDWQTGLSGTTMTHPNYRGQGLFPILARNTYERMTKSGMAMVWGFPNAMSHRGFVKDLSWTDIYEVPTFRLPLSSAVSLPAPGPALVELQQFDERFDLLWERVKDDHSVVTKRNQRHLQWRYVDNPTERYRILAYGNADGLLGYAVFKRYKDELQVVDLLTVRDTEVSVRLLSGVVQAAHAEAAAAISLWFGVTHPLHHTLERFGFRLGEPVTYFGALAFQSQVETYNFRNWYLTMGDSDVF
jgi:hypothetical protein